MNPAACRRLTMAETRNVPTIAGIGEIGLGDQKHATAHATGVEHHFRCPHQLKRPRSIVSIRPRSLAICPDVSSLRDCRPIDTRAEELGLHVGGEIRIRSIQQVRIAAASQRA